MLTNNSIPPSVFIGKGTKLAYTGLNVIINKGVRIGSNCIIGVNVTFGGRSKNVSGEMIIGDEVFIGANAIILGNVKIGSYSIIAPGSVVLTDVPERGMFAGNPAKLKKVYEPGSSYKTIL